MADPSEPNSKKRLPKLELEALADSTLDVLQTWCVGNENAVVGKQLNIMVYRQLDRPVPKDTRQLRRAINYLIEQGEVICSCSGKKEDELQEAEAGYWLAASREDAQPARAELASRRIEITKRENQLAANLEAKFPRRVVQMALGLDVEDSRKPIHLFQR